MAPQITNHPSTRFKLAQGRSFDALQACSGRAFRHSPAIGYWLLAIGYWLSAIGYRLFAKRCAALLRQHEIPDNRSEIAATRNELSERAPRWTIGIEFF